LSAGLTPIETPLDGFVDVTVNVRMTVPVVKDQAFDQIPGPLGPFAATRQKYFVPLDSPLTIRKVSTSDVSFFTKPEANDESTPNWSQYPVLPVLFPHFTVKPTVGMPVAPFAGLKRIGGSGSAVVVKTRYIIAGPGQRRSVPCVATDDEESHMLLVPLTRVDVGRFRRSNE
jgi:hypothetical protein